MHLPVSFRELWTTPQSTNETFSYTQQLPRLVSRLRQSLCVDSLDVEQPAGLYSRMDQLWTSALQLPGIRDIVCTDPVMEDIRRKILSPPDQALGVICGDWKSTVMSKHVRQDGYLRLASFVDR